MINPVVNNSSVVNTSYQSRNQQQQQRSYQGGQSLIGQRVTTARQANVRYQIVDAEDGQEEEEEETCLTERRINDESDNDSSVRLNVNGRSEFRNRNRRDRNQSSATRSSASDREPIYHAADGESETGSSDYERVH